MKDKVSIITTYYNAEKFVLNAVNSIIQQKTDDDFKIEYVLIDDKSPDNSSKLIKKFLDDTKGKFNNDIEVRMIEAPKNLGCGGARRFGIESATGDYYMFLDADDYYINADFVKRAYHVIKDTKSDIVEYGIIFNTGNGSQHYSVSREVITITDPTMALISCFKDNLIKFNVWTKIYTKEIIGTFKYSEERTFEDVRTIPVWLSNAKKITIMPSVEINYRATSGSIIREDDIKSRIGTITAIASLFPRFKDNERVLKEMYVRAMVDLEAVLSNHSSENKGFNEMSRLNTEMLKYIYPKKYKEMTYHIEDDKEWQAQEVEYEKRYKALADSIKDDEG